jgi:hypothetical protein
LIILSMTGILLFQIVRCRGGHLLPLVSGIDKPLV